MATAETIKRREDLARGPGVSAPGQVNVGETERLISKVGGGVLVGLGLVRGGVRGLALAGLGATLLYRGVTGKCELYRAIGADTSYKPGAADSIPAQSGVRVEEAILVSRPAAELYRFWRDYANLPKFMADIESVAATDGPAGKHSHWVMKGPLGVQVEWDSEVIEEESGRMIAWRSTGGHLATAGSVHFHEEGDGRGTEVRINQKFDPPGGKVGVALAKLIGHDPASVTRQTLARFKQMMEAGATTPGHA